MNSPTLEESIEHLRHMEQYQVVIEYIRYGRERAISELPQCRDPHDTMRTAGTIIAYDEMLGALSPA